MQCVLASVGDWIVMEVHDLFLTTLDFVAAQFVQADTQSLTYDGGLFSPANESLALRVKCALVNCSTTNLISFAGVLGDSIPYSHRRPYCRGLVSALFRV